jgi:hypothetical protein
MMNRYFDPTISGIFCIQSSKSGYNRSGRLRSVAHATSGADNNGLQFLDGSTQFFVDDQKVVVLVLLDFIKGDSQTLLDYVVFIQTAVLEALTENLKRGRHDENTNRLRPALPNALGALDINIQQDVVSLRQNLVNQHLRRTVVVAVDLSPFEKLPAQLQIFKPGPVDEVILDTILFIAAGQPCGVRNRKPELRNLLEKASGQN